MDFVGDGQYVCDGGRSLQRIWESTNWREIKGCPGRYTTLKTYCRWESPPEMLKRVLGFCRLRDIHRLKRAGKDDLIVAFLHPGGGLLTYVHPDLHGVTDKGYGGTGDIVVYVHTLNTAAGFARKLVGLGLPW
ncbi:unnamed protein product, partial [Phaeothamnion confervicola]